MSPWLVLGAVAAIASVYVLIPVGVAMRTRARALRQLTCPDTGKTADVRFGRAGWAEALGLRALRQVRFCSLAQWPGCASACRALPEEELRASHRTS